MSTPDDLPRADQAPGAPHPRETAQLFGQTSAEAAFLEAFNSGRLHHAWLLTGPQGIGKATLAWRIARFLLATPPAQEDGLFGAPPAPETLEIDPEHPVSRRILAGAEPGLASITRSYNDKDRLRDQIVVDDIRALSKFFGLSAADGGHRVVIVDAADEMNIQAANALLKMLEEPPARTTLLLIAHQPTRLLPTIRSRCRTLRLNTLSPQDMTAVLEQAGADLPAAPEALATLAAGSAGTAMRLLAHDGLGLYAGLTRLLNSMPRTDRRAALALADLAAARGQADRFDLILDLFDFALARLARTGACGTAPQPAAAPDEAQMLQRLSPDAHKARAWAALAAKVSQRARHGQAVNLDPGALVLDTVFKMQETARS